MCQTIGSRSVCMHGACMHVCLHLGSISPNTAMSMDKPLWMYSLHQFTYRILATPNRSTLAEPTCVPFFCSFFNSWFFSRSAFFFACSASFASFFFCASASFANRFCFFSSVSSGSSLSSELSDEITSFGFSLSLSLSFLSFFWPWQPSWKPYRFLIWSYQSCSCPSSFSLLPPIIHGNGNGSWSKAV